MIVESRRDKVLVHCQGQCGGRAIMCQPSEKRVARRSNTATTSSANFMPTTSSSRQGSSVRDCFSTSPSPSLSSSGAPSVPGCAPFVPAFPPPNSSSLSRYAIGYPNFSSMPTKATSSPNSSSNDRTPTKCRPSASPPEPNLYANPGLTSFFL